MTCEELRQDYGSYALGIAEGPELVEIEEHLARGCPQCTPGVCSAMGTVAAMSGAVKLADPPARLRRRVVTMVAPPKRLTAAVWIPWAVAGALAVALLSIAIPGRGRSSDTARLQSALSILNDPVTRDITFGEPAARGRVFVSPGKGVVFIAAHLPKLDENKTFELWVIPQAGNPIPAGTFRSEADSSAVHVRPGPVENAAAIAVTVEPNGGSPQPTTTPFIVSKL